MDDPPISRTGAVFIIFASASSHVDSWSTCIIWSWTLALTFTHISSSSGALSLQQYIWTWIPYQCRDSKLIPPRLSDPWLLSSFLSINICTIWTWLLSPAEVYISTCCPLSPAAIYMNLTSSSMQGQQADSPPPRLSGGEYQDHDGRLSFTCWQ